MKIDIEFTKLKNALMIGKIMIEKPNREKN